MELESLPTTAQSEIPIFHSIPQTVFKGHEAGVTAILPLPVLNHGLGELLLTGSYDDYVRVYTTYDTRPIAKNTTGKALAELKIGGGVWRLKFLDAPRQVNDRDGRVKLKVLASCMHAGARILEVTRAGSDGQWEIGILGSVTAHESMCYGSDVQPTEDSVGDGERVCVSTSFYDRLVCVWRFDPNRLEDPSD